MRKSVLAVLTAALIYIAPMCVSAQQPAPTVQSETAVVIDAATGQVLYNKNMHQKMYPASTTKVMTGLLALENSNLTDTITMSYDAVFSVGRNTSHIALTNGEQLTVENALYALAIESANDAANGIAEHVGGSMNDFANLMTTKAKSLGALNTNFTNAHGLHDENHYTTAYDLAMIARQAVTNQDFNKIFGVEKYTMPATNKQSQERSFNSANWFLNTVLKYDGMLMSKTGWTTEAGHTMVTAAQRNGTTLIAVVMKSEAKKDKFNDTVAMLDWAFENYQTVEVLPTHIVNYAPEVLTCVEYKNYFVEKENLNIPITSIVLDKNYTYNDIQAEYVEPIFNVADSSAQVNINLYLLDEDGTRKDLTTVTATAPLTQKQTVISIKDSNGNIYVKLLIMCLISIVTFAVCVSVSSRINRKYKY